MFYSILVISCRTTSIALLLDLPTISQHLPYASAITSCARSNPPVWLSATILYAPETPHIITSPQPPILYLTIPKHPLLHAPPPARTSSSPPAPGSPKLEDPLLVLPPQHYHRPFCTPPSQPSPPSHTAPHHPHMGEVGGRDVARAVVRGPDCRGRVWMGVMIEGWYHKTVSENKVGVQSSLQNGGTLHSPAPGDASIRWIREIVLDYMCGD